MWILLCTCISSSNFRSWVPFSSSLLLMMWILLCTCISSSNFRSCVWEAQLGPICFFPRTPILEVQFGEHVLGGCVLSPFKEFFWCSRVICGTFKGKHVAYSQLKAFGTNGTVRLTLPFSSDTIIGNQLQVGYISTFGYNLLVFFQDTTFHSVFT
jgi:hypothetical protein